MELAKGCEAGDRMRACGWVSSLENIARDAQPGGVNIRKRFFTSAEAHKPPCHSSGGREQIRLQVALITPFVHVKGPAAA